MEASASRIVVTHAQFYHYLLDDLEKARHRIVIYSPFITRNRLGDLAPQLRAAVDRGVSVYVVTKASSDRKRREIEKYRNLEKTLAQWGIRVVHKRGMHEKLVFIENDIVWTGSLNPLSFTNTQEIMERRRSGKVFEEYIQRLRLNELLDPYGEGCPTCPICGKEMVASEGTDEPFYWTCIDKGCYSRSIDQPALTDGMIVCANCGGRVKFGAWGDEPVWRCVENPRHRQRIARSHLRLPKMRELVPRRQLVKLEKILAMPRTERNQMEAEGEQLPLFDF